MKILINPEPDDPQRPYKHTQPIVDFLIANGNEITTDPAGFYMTQGGWVCDLRFPIDYESVDATFILPSSINFG